MRITGRTLLIVTTLLLGACAAPLATSAPSQPAAPASPAAGASAGSSATPDWYGIELTDVRTGRPFTINDFAGKVVLVEAMAEWCPTCIEQQREVGKLHEQLANPDDLVSISLDIDINEDGPSLKTYAEALGHDWRYAVAPLDVARALGNLYSAEYLNPPYSPILLIDRDGVATSLPYGVKTADYLQTTLAPYLSH